MLGLTQLWLPILVSAIFVFVASSIIHMVFKWHNSDYRKLPNEDDVRAVLNKEPLPPGQYAIPYSLGMSEMQSPDIQAKYEAGPNGLIFVGPKGLPNMGKLLGTWFTLCLGIAIFAALIAGAALDPGASGSSVFHVVSIACLLAYGAGSISSGIWRVYPWRAVVFDLLDALIYAVISGFTFAWLWPAAA